jgi:hypothetical protein
MAETPQGVMELKLVAETVRTATVGIKVEGDIDRRDLASYKQYDG